jgi:hypothetical protein
VPVDPSSPEWQWTKRFVRLLHTTVRAISAADPAALLASLAPPDEYDHEAAQITRLVLAEATGPQDVERIVTDVFAHAFGGVIYDTSRFGDIARDVWRRAAELGRRPD